MNPGPCRPSPLTHHVEVVLLYLRRTEQCCLLEESLHHSFSHTSAPLILSYSLQARQIQKNGSLTHTLHDATRDGAYDVTMVTGEE